MHPQTKVEFDFQSIERVKNIIKNISIARKKRKENPRYAIDIPEEVGIQLTYRCNLRCKHCFQLGNEGFFHTYSKEIRNKDLDIGVVEKILKSTQLTNSKLYIWGGEPFVHKQWDEISSMLINFPRWIVLCTNGLLLKEKIHTLIDVSSNLVLLVSIEGFEEGQDELRGKGTYKKLIKNLEYVLELKKKGIYKGKISLHLVISDTMAPCLYEFMEYWEKEDIDTVYFCFPWYISQETAKKMDGYYQENFSWLRKLSDIPSPSWHGYSYHLKPESLDIVHREYQKLLKKDWNIRIRFNPPLNPQEFENFINGSHIPGCNIKECYAVSNRMDVLADGQVTTCQLFPEFSVGNLYEKSVIEVWKGENFSKAREIFSKGLMPICSKCALLYLNSR